MTDLKTDLKKTVVMDELQPRSRERPPSGSFAEFARSIGPVSKRKVQQVVQAWFSVVEHDLAELGRIDYTDREDACVPEAYINAVVHIKIGGAQRGEGRGGRPS